MPQQQLLQQQQQCGFVVTKHSHRMRLQGFVRAVLLQGSGCRQYPAYDAIAAQQPLLWPCCIHDCLVPAN
jgi:hypothetical protein